MEKKQLRIPTPTGQERDTLDLVAGHHYICATKTG